MKRDLRFLSFVFVVFFLPLIAAAEVMPLGTQGIFITDISTDTVCPGDNIDVDFACSSITPTGTLSVELSDAAGSFASPVVIATVAASNSGTITATVPANTLQGSGYRLRVTSSAPVYTGSTNGAPIRVNPLPQPNIIPGGPIELCVGDALTLSADQAYPAVAWAVDDIIVSSLPSHQSVPNNGECYKLLAFNEYGCSAFSDPLCVTVSPLPQPIITPSGPTTFCEGDGVVLTANFGYDTYQWHMNNISFPPSADSIIVANGENGDCYIVEVTDANGCTGLSNQICITVFPLPEPVITSIGPYCNDGVCITLTATPAGGTFSALAGVSGDSFCAPDSGSYPVTYTYTDQNGCTGTVTQDVEVYSPTPVITAAGSTTFCEGDSVILHAGQGYATYWWVENGVTQVGIGESIVVHGGNPDCYEVYVTDAIGCLGLAEEVCVTVLPLPEPVITADGPLGVCDGECVTLSAGPGYNCYDWSTGENTQSIMVCDSATYYLQVCGVNGCTSELVSVDVIIYPPVNPVIVPDGPTTFCEGECVNLWLQVQYSSVIWSPTGSTNPNTEQICDSGNVEVWVWDLHGCMDTAEIDITVYPAPDPVITINGTTLTCTPTFPIYQWNYNGAPITTGGTSQTYPADTNCGDYTVSVVDINGCMATSDTVYCPLGVDELTANDFKIYPNPATNTITIEQLAGSHLSFVKIMNALGEVIYDGSIINQQSNINIAGFSSGIYFLSLSDGKKTVGTKFIKE